MVSECIKGVGGDNARRCRAERECHFGAIADVALNISTPVSRNDPVALALARFSSVPHGCAAYFKPYIDARNKLPPDMLSAAGNSESLCDSKRAFGKADIAAATFTAIANAAVFVVIGCITDHRRHTFSEGY